MNIYSRDILANIMEYRKIKYLIFKKYIANIIKQFNIEEKLFTTGS